MDPQRPIPPEPPVREGSNSLYVILAAVIALLAVVVWFVSTSRETGVATTAPDVTTSTPAATATAPAETAPATTASAPATTAAP